MNRKEQLIKLGFSVLDDEWKRMNNVDEDEPLYYYNGFVYELGDSRRGQIYYLIVVGDDLNIYATKPSGSGSSIVFTKENAKLINKVFEVISSHRVVWVTNKNQSDAC